MSRRPPRNTQTEHKQRGLALWGHPVLRQQAHAIRRFDSATEQLVADLWAGLRRFQGVGLAAPQLGLPLRAFVVEYEGTLLTCLNPEVVPVPGLGGTPVTADEACLSLPGVYARNVERVEQIHLRYRTVLGRTREHHADGWLARVLWHEMDHLDGVLLCDKVPSTSIVPLRYTQPSDGL